MSKRIIPVDRKKAKELKGLMGKARNNTERKRIQILIQYLSWMWIRKVMEHMLVSSATVESAVHWYKEKWEDFYKTNYKWRQEDKHHKKLVTQAKGIIEWEDNVDINEVRRRLEKMNWEEYGYDKIYWLVRRKMWYNYQKPFVTSNKQSDYAKEIAEWRLRKWVYQIASKEWKIDAESVQNKKI